MTRPGLSLPFKLRDVADIVPWGEPGSKMLHWFGLSDGCYCIETPAGRLLEHDGPADAMLGVPWCDYAVTRLFEDLLEIWPAVAEPVPEDIAARYFAWSALNAEAMTERDDDAFFDALETASSWWHKRRLDFGYLATPPRLHFWRIGSTMNLEWQADPPWLPRTARSSVAFASARDGVARFFRDFLAAMGQRVAAIERDGWQRNDCHLDVAHLVKEQEERSEWPASAFSRTSDTNWDVVRRSLTEIRA